MENPDPHQHEPVLPKEAEEAYKELDFNSPEHSLLSCPKCNHFISGRDINIEKTLAQCSNCQHVFSFEHDSQSKRLKPIAAMPKGVETLRLRSELDIRLKWTDTTIRNGRTFLTLFTVMWNIILLPFVIGILVSGSYGILLFMAAHLAVGLGLLWNMAAIHLNRTSISVTKRKIRVRTIPIKSFLWRSKDLNVDEITQLYVTRYTQSTTNGNPNYAYALYAIMQDGEKISLVRGMNRETQVYVEQEIEGYLGIKNQKVPEESKE